MTWQEITEKRTRTAKHFQESYSRRRVFQSVIKTPLHYGSAPGAADWSKTVDMRDQPVDNGDLDGLALCRSDFHCRIGHMKHNHRNDGWFAIEGQQGKANIGLRLHRAGVIHWPSQQFSNLIDSPDYNRQKLTRTVGDVMMGVDQDIQTIHASNVLEWADLWPGVSLRWLLDGRKVKTEVQFSATARKNILPVSNSLDDYFCLIFQLDLGLMGLPGVAKFKQAGQEKTLSQGFDDGNDQLIALEGDNNELLAIMPLDNAYSEKYEWAEDQYLEQDETPLIKRLYARKGKTYLAVGAPLPQLHALHEGAIVFDPTFEDQPDATDGKDSFLDGAATTTNRGTVVRMRADTDDKFPIIFFDASSIAASATCDSATLSLWSEDSSSEKDYGVHSLHSNVSDWSETDSTWINYKSGTAWPGSSGAETSGTDYEAALLGTITYPNSSADTEATVALTASRIEGWFGASNSNYGLIMAKTGNSTSGRDWHSSDGSTASQRPKISIVYTEGGSDVTVSPDAAAAIAGLVDPTVLKGSLTLLPGEASTIGSKADPAIVFGSLAIVPAQAEAIAALVDPDVQITGGGEAVAPAAASAIGSKADPAIVLGSLALTPGAAEAIAALVGPTVLAGNLTLTPSEASAIAVVIDPSVLLGSLALVPAQASAIGAVFGPTVQEGGDLALTPAAASAIGSKADPAIVLGSLALTPGAAAAIAALVGPTVLAGNLTLTPSEASAIAAVVDPSVQISGGGETVAPAAASAIAALVDPSVLAGSLSLTPGAAEAIATLVDPSVLAGSLALVPAQASAIGAVVNPTIPTGGSVILPTPADVVTSVLLLGVFISSGTQLIDVVVSDRAAFIVVVSDQSKS